MRIEGEIPAREATRDLGPAVAHLAVQVNQHGFLCLGPVMPSEVWVEVVVKLLSAFLGSFVKNVELFCQNWGTFGPALYPTVDSEFHQCLVLLDRLFCTYGSQLLEALMIFADFYYIIYRLNKGIKAGANPNLAAQGITAGIALLWATCCSPWNISLTKTFISQTAC